MKFLEIIQITEFQEEMANFPAFDISHFQKIFSTVIGQSVPLRANSYFGSTADPTYPKNFGFQSTKGKVRKLLHEQHGMSDNSKHEMEIDKEWNKGKWTRNRFLREPQNDVSYKLFGAMPKFDPRFPFDRAYKLMEDLQPPKTLKFPSIHFYI